MSSLKKFCISTFGPHIPWCPAPSWILALFATDLYTQGKSKSTILTTMSGISFYHNLLYNQDPTSDFIVKRVMLGISKCGPSVDNRLPITINMLHNLYDVLPKVTDCAYLTTMYRCMMLIMFYSFLRISEVTNSPHNLAFSNVKVHTNSIEITLDSYKHSQNERFSITIPASNSKYCPVTNTIQYIKLRGSHNGPFFGLPGIIPVKSSDFSDVLTRAAKFCNFDCSKIKPHSFRIGAASHSAALGYTSSQIKRIGRWRSNSFERYIRIFSFKSF